LPIRASEGWETPQKAVVKVELTFLGTNICYVVTNLDNIRTKELYEKGYFARGAMELFFRIPKTDLDLRTKYHKTDDASVAHLHLGLLTYWLVSAKLSLN
jgi:hypothetical protein